MDEGMMNKEEFADLLKGELMQLRQEMRQDMNKLRQEMRQDMNKLRQEMRQDMNERIDKLRREIKQEMEELRQDMKRIKRQLTWRIDDMEDELYYMKKSTSRHRRIEVETPLPVSTVEMKTRATPALGGIRGCDWDSSGESLD